MLISKERSVRVVSANQLFLRSREVKVAVLRARASRLILILGYSQGGQVNSFLGLRIIFRLEDGKVRAFTDSTRGVMI